jgi:hypothetical protein
LDDTVTCLVRGAGSRYPRGFIWLIPAWFAIAAAAVIAAGDHASGRLPLWLGLSEIGGLLIAFFTLLCVLATVRRRAFGADQHGIWLGVRTSRKRPRLRQVQLAWPEIAQLRMVPRRYGLLLEITLSPAARIVHRPGLARQALVLAGALILPFGFGRGRPALTMPRLDPPRYLIKICDHDPAQLRAALAPVKPDNVQLRLLAKKGALRFRVPPPREPVRPSGLRPQPKPQSKPQPKPKAQLKSQPKPQSRPKPKPKSQPKSQPHPQPHPAPEPEPQTQPSGSRPASPVAK